MRILHAVEFYAPSVGGAQEVVRQVSTRLAARGHEVTVATTALPARTQDVIDGVRVVGFDCAGNAVRGMRGDLDGYRRFVAASGADVAMVYAAQQWTCDALLPALETIPLPVVLAPCGFSGLHDPAYGGYFAELPGRLERTAHLILHSATYRDARFVQEHGLERWSVIANGAAAEEFDRPAGGFREQHGIAPDEPLLLTVGSHTGQKGHAAAIEAFRQARIGRATLVVVGNTALGTGCLRNCQARALGTRALSLGRKRVLIVDPPRAEVVAAYAAADLFVFASAIECSPLVLFESVAAGTPFLSVPVGNSAEIAGWTGGGEIVAAPSAPDGRVLADPATLARELERLLGDRPRLAALGQAGRAAWQARFTWDAIVDEYERVYERAAAARAA